MPVPCMSAVIISMLHTKKPRRREAGRLAKITHAALRIAGASGQAKTEALLCVIPEPVFLTSPACCASPMSCWGQRLQDYETFLRYASELP